MADGEWKTLVRDVRDGRGVDTDRKSDFVFKIILMGDSGVGKTSLWHVFCAKKPMSADDRAQLYSTVGVDFAHHQILISQNLVELMIWDTAGQEKYDSITMSYVRGAVGIIFVYDVTRPESFNHLINWWQKVYSRIDPDKPPLVMVVGNKVDTPPEHRAVPRDAATEMCERLNFSYMETSALTGAGVSDAFLFFGAAIFVQNIRQRRASLLLSPLVPSGNVPRSDALAVNRTSLHDELVRITTSHHDTPPDPGIVSLAEEEEIADGKCTC